MAALILALAALALLGLGLFARRRTHLSRGASPPVPWNADWTAEEHAYHGDPTMLVTCAHLRPLEKAARAQIADCRLVANEPAAAFVMGADRGEEAIAFFVLGPTVRYEESERIGPHEYSDPTYRCTACNSSIAFIQRNYLADTPEFELREKDKVR